MSLGSLMLLKQLPLHTRVRCEWVGVCVSDGKAGNEIADELAS